MFPLPVRLLGLLAAVLFGATAVQIVAGVQVMPTTSPLPFYAYPVLVATLVGWIWTLVAELGGVIVVRERPMGGAIAVTLAMVLAVQHLRYALAIISNRTGHRV